MSETDDHTQRRGDGMNRPTIRVRNWDKFQHYKDRSPPWIKLYNDLLENYDFSRLQDASKAHLVGIWLLAARTENALPADEKWIAGKIGATDTVDLQPLVDGGFIEVLGVDSEALASRKQGAIPETEAEREKETDSVRDQGWPLDPPKDDSGNLVYPEAFERAWAVYPSREGNNPKKPAYRAFRILVRKKEDPDELALAAERYADQCKKLGELGTRYVSHASTFWGPGEPWRDFVGEDAEEVPERRPRELDPDVIAEIEAERDRLEAVGQ